ncbi:pancreatic lipase-related protein 2-like [Microcaecilia unicolor]|uniref:Pancreatic lipase-related protein 2-like n=1 Tax=Microcaecilia unicolor TaxID=1415580 RepID=A0A6P7YCL5_9AMPH|nr:pancreatic lipase-related protein 2-like [Microcaecilia unicolor]
MSGSTDRGKQTIKKMPCQCAGATQSYSLFRTGEQSSSQDGLTPISRYFDNTPAEVRLDKSDAQIVDVIHTDLSYVSGYGTSQTVGHLDFYTNRYHEVSRCAAGSDFNCDYFRSVHYYSESIVSPNGFLGYPCGLKSAFLTDCFTCPKRGCPMMGHYADSYDGITNKSQIFQLRTRSNEPYSQWLYKLSVNIRSNDKYFVFTVVLYRQNGKTQTYKVNRNAPLFYDSLIYAEEYIGTVYKVTVQWGYTSFSAPKTFRVESVTLQFTQYSHANKFCNTNHEGVGMAVLQTFLPC